MDRQASLDLLNATHSFPCEFTLKVIGQSSDDFIDRCVEAVRVVALHSPDIPYTTRSTPNGRHISITMQPTIDSAEQVLQVYASLRDVEGVVMAM